MGPMQPDSAECIGVIQDAGLDGFVLAGGGHLWIHQRGCHGAQNSQGAIPQLITDLQ